ncbi:hypothetical protein Desaci_2534 [Desulfosporosinus acidiphilus SJ4]|uniref:Uncharacterized protein n=1 Tax=Desulfosporosinus acidiphilus (strain DSM 22704 / JCM 16185 / SJ4) TaxID=646529 RepID=I4D6Q2_DESAJ|nr:hypothetical protein [Desulfosporosinus acidiphilus]AFM41476.1 hypothetical protein Desaci_2534 [Desulfosporosinus acidiphilus SJ4]
MRWLLKLYPRVWRERYEDEMLIVLEEHKITPTTMFDLLLGAIDANFNYNGFTEGIFYMINRVRSGIVMIFCSFMLYGIGWSLLQRLNDPIPNFQVINTIHPEFGVIYKAIFIVGFISFLAFLIGGLPILYISVKRAYREGKQNVLSPFWAALSCLLLFVILTTILVIWHPQGHIYTILIGYLLLSALFLVVGTVAVSFVIARTEFKLPELKLVYIPEIVILFGMVVSVMLSTILIARITTNAPQLFITQDVSSTMFITGIILMSLSTIFAVIGLKRGTIAQIDQFIQE